VRVSTALQRRGYLECRWVVPSHTAGSTHWNTIRENHDAPASPPLMRGSSGSPSSCAATGAYPSLLIFLLAYNAPTGAKPGRYAALGICELRRRRRAAHARHGATVPWCDQPCVHRMMMSVSSGSQTHPPIPVRVSIGPTGPRREREGASEAPIASAHPRECSKE
jgi:hypothetical protein